MLKHAHKCLHSVHMSSHVSDSKTFLFLWKYVTNVFDKKWTNVFRRTRDCKLTSRLSADAQQFSFHQWNCGQLTRFSVQPYRMNWWPKVVLTTQETVVWSFWANRMFQYSTWRRAVFPRECNLPEPQQVKQLHVITSAGFFTVHGTIRNENSMSFSKSPSAIGCVWVRSRFISLQNSLSII